MKSDYSNEQRYLQAKKKVEKLSKFYKHLSVYLVVNIILSTVFIIGDIKEGDTFNEAFFNSGNFKIWFWWGIIIVFQALNTFTISLIFGRDWEERKLNEYLEEEKRRYNG